jgi:hypothetical protein
MTTLLTSASGADTILSFFPFVLPFQVMAAMKSNGNQNFEIWAGGSGFRWKQIASSYQMLGR